MLCENKIKFNFILFLFVTLWNLVFSTNIDNLKGTYSILPKELLELSVSEGAIAWHTGTIMNLYDFGHATKGEPIKKVSINELKKWNKTIKSVSIRDILRTLFYRIPGTKGRADFRLTNLLLNDDKEFSKQIAKALIEIWLYKQIESKFSKQIDGILTVKFSDILPGLGQKNAIKNALQDSEFDGYSILRYAMLAAVWVKLGSDKKSLKLYYDSIKSEFSEIIIKLSACMAKLDEKNKTEILKWVHEIKIAQIQITDKWVVDTFKGQKQNVEESIQSITLENLREPDNYEKIIYVALSKFEDIPYLTNVTLKIDGKNQKMDGKEVKFADCAENVLRNLLNNILYNPISGNFDLGRLDNVSPDNKLKMFYSEFTLQNSADTKAHDDWSDVVSNIPWVEYCRIIGSDKDAARFIKIPENNLTPQLKEFLDNNKYTVISDKGKFEFNGIFRKVVFEDTVEFKDRVAFEIQPCFRNLIIILNHILGLKLFEGKQLSAEFIRPDFIQKYLPEGIAKIKNCVIAKMPEQIDKLDFGTGAADVVVKLKNATNLTERSLYINIEFRIHTEFMSQNEAEGQALDVLQRIDINNIKELPESIMFLLSENTFERLLETGYQNYLALFAQDVFSKDTVLEFLGKATNPDMIQKLFKFLRFLYTKNLTDPDEILTAEINLYSIFLKKSLDQEKTFYKEIVTSASDATTIELKDLKFKFNRREDLKRLWEHLFEKKQGFDAAILAARKVGQSDVLMALDLWHLLLQYKDNANEATKENIKVEAIKTIEEVMLANKQKAEVSFGILKEWINKKYYELRRACNLAEEFRKHGDLNSSLKLWLHLTRSCNLKDINNEILENRKKAVEDGEKSKDVRNLNIVKQLSRLLGQQQKTAIDNLINVACR